MFSAWQGERCIPNDISQYKRTFRVYRFDLSRVGPCVRPQSSRISGKWSLLSKGLRGGKSRRLREVSLLRRMIASEDAKNPLQIRKQKGIQGYGLAISAYKEGMKWWSQGSLRRHKCNVRRIHYQAKTRVNRKNTPSWKKGSVGGKAPLRVQMRSSALRWCNVCRSRNLESPVNTV